MPLYTYRCVCSAITDAFRSVENRDDCPPCETCGGETHKIISRYRVHSDMAPYYDDNLETHIKSRQHRKKVMKDKGVSEIYGKGWM